jgi:molybdopterin converting factor small subunit
MDVRVMLFAQLRERAGAREVISGMPVVMAVNHVYVRGDPPLSPGDELALIPPVSGGA